MSWLIIISDDETLESRIRLNPMIQPSVIDDELSEDLDIDGYIYARLCTSLCC